jgi:hypothetical protein
MLVRGTPYLGSLSTLAKDRQTAQEEKPKPKVVTMSDEITEEEKKIALEFFDAAQLYVHVTPGDLIAAIQDKDYPRAVLIKQTREALRDVLNMKRYEMNRFSYFDRVGYFE